MPYTIWSNADLPAADLAELQSGIAPHRLELSNRRTGNLGVTGPDPTLASADIAFGQPDPKQVIDSPNLKWIHLTAAGYTRYDRPDLRAALRARDAKLTNSSAVFAEPCAQHLLAMMMSLARRLPQSQANQLGPRQWPAGQLRRESFLLNGQTALIFGFGAIGRRLVELLGPLHMNLIALRRRVAGDEPIKTFPMDRADVLLPEADHVINILPAATETDGFFTAARFAAMKPGAIFYNIGRGSTVDQPALVTALQSHHIGVAYLDVMTPEPLPPDDPLWKIPTCFITPHSAGGHADEFHRLTQHFLQNLKRYEAGSELKDRVF